MPSHYLRRVAWGLTWRWSVLFASLIAPAPSAAIVGVGILLVAGFVTLIWRRHDWLGTAWRVLLAVAVVNLGFWLGSPLLVPAITAALVVTVVDLLWSLTDAPARPVADVVEAPVTALEPVLAASVAEPVFYPNPEPVIYLKSEPVLDPAVATLRRRASRRDTAAGLRMLVAACMVVTIFTVAAFTMASRASAGLAGVIASLGQRVDQITAVAPSVSPAPTPRPTPQPTPSPTPDPITALIPNGGSNPSLDQLPRIDVSKLCVSLPDHRYEVRLPDGQVVVVTTKHRDGCPDLGVILKALQNAGGNSD